MSKVVFVQPVVPKYRESFFRELSVQLSDDFELFLLSSERDENGVSSIDKAIDGYTLCNFSLPRLSLFNRLFFQSLPKEIVRLNKSDVLVISGNARYISSLLFALIAKMQGAKVFWWGQAWSSTSKSWRAKIRHKIMGYFDKIILYTDGEIRRLNDLFHMDKVSALNNGLDVDYFRTVYDFKEEGLRDDFSHNELLFIGRLTAKSNILMLVEAISLIEESKRPVLNVIGSGQLECEVKQLVNVLSLSDYVRFFGEVYDENEISYLMSRSSFFVYPGSVGLSLIHAFSYGVPAILHDNELKHMPEYSAFISNYNGFSFKEGDVLDLSNVICLGLADSFSQQYLRNNAYGTVTYNFNTKNMAERFSKIIKAEI